MQRIERVVYLPNAKQSHPAMFLTPLSFSSIGPPRQSLVKLMLPHKQTDHKPKQRKARGSHEHGAQRIHVDLHHGRLPARRQRLGVLHAIPDLGDDLRRTLPMPEPVPQLRLQQVLKDSRRDRDPDGGAGAAKRVGRRGDDGLVLVVDGGDEREQGNGQHARLAESRAEEGDERHPSGRVEREEDRDRVRRDHQRHDHHAEPVVDSERAHDEARGDGAQADTYGEGDEARACLRRAQALHLEVDRRVEDEREHGHGAEPVGEAGAEHGAVAHLFHREDGFGGDAGFDEDEECEDQPRQRQADVHEGMVPGDDVAARVEAEEQKDEGGDERESAQEVDALDLRLAGFLDWNADREEAQDAHGRDERDLDPERPAPADGVVDPASENATEGHAEPVVDVPDPLPHASPPQRDQVRADEGGDGVQAAASAAGDHPSQNHNPVALGDSADDGAYAEDDAGADEARAPAVDVRQLAGDGLEGGVGDDVARGDPGEEGQRIERVGDGRRQGGDYGRVQRGQESAYPDTSHDEHAFCRGRFFSNGSVIAVAGGGLFISLYIVVNRTTAFACMVLQQWPGFVCVSRHFGSWHGPQTSGERERNMKY